MKNCDQIYYAVNPKLGFSIDCKTRLIYVDIDTFCEKYSKTFDQICQDESIINSILDTYLEIKRIYKIL